MPQLYEVVVTGTGEVRDKDGNLKSVEPIESTLVLTEEQVRALTEGESQ